MINRKLGRSNIESSAMGLGCYAIGGQFRVENGQQWGWTGVDDEESIRAIHAVMDFGINFFNWSTAKETQIRALGSVSIGLCHANVPATQQRAGTDRAPIVGETPSVGR